MAALQPPVPNAANLQAAVNGMTVEGNTIVQSVQAYNTHQQALNTELSLCANYNVAQIHQQLAAMQASIAAIEANTAAIQASVATIQGNVATIQADVATVQADVATIQADVTTVQTSISIIDAKSWNSDAKLENAKVSSSTGILAVLRSVDPGAPAQIGLNILNFPATPDAVSQMTVQDCRAVLTALNKHTPQGPHIGVRQLRTAVRKAIGLLSY